MRFLRWWVQARVQLQLPVQWSIWIFDSQLVCDLRHSQTIRFLDFSDILTQLLFESTQIVHHWKDLYEFMLIHVERVQIHLD
jgi:hypothetical protein